MVITTSGISFERIWRSFSCAKPEVFAGTDEGLRKKAEGSTFLSAMKFLVNRLLNILGKGDALKASFVRR